MWISVADPEIAGEGWWVRTIVRAAAAGRPEARPPPVSGFRGITPEKILKLYIAKDAFSCIVNGICSAILHLKTRDEWLPDTS